MVVIDERLEQVLALTLASGGHDSFEEGVCVMEAVAWVAGEPFSDHPECASPVIAAFMRRWNDDLDDEGRQMLKPLIPRLVGTAATAEVEARRGWMCADWLVRVHTPAWLELAGAAAPAAALRTLPELHNAATLRTARPVIDEARSAGAAARTATRDALAPTAKGLQVSAIELVERMCDLA